MRNITYLAQKKTQHIPPPLSIDLSQGAGIY